MFARRLHFLRLFLITGIVVQLDIAPVAENEEEPKLPVDDNVDHDDNIPPRQRGLWD